MKKVNHRVAAAQRPKSRIALSSYALVFGVSVVMLFGAVAASGQDKSPKKEAPKLLPMGEVAPDWTLNDSTGKPRTLSENRGKVVVLDFWATWCGPCAEVMPRMQKLHEKYGDQGVVVFGVNSWEKSDPVALMQKKRFNYGLLLKGENLAEAYKITTLPVVYIIGEDGKIIYCHEGADDKHLDSLIEKYLKAHRTIT